jgi:hypothetical protein
VTIPGTAHQQGQQALLYQVYDTSTPRQAMQPDTFAVYPSFDAVVTFGVPQSGVIMVAALAPQYVTAFTTTGTPPSVTIPGGTHGLGQTFLFYQIYDTGTPAQATELGSLSVNATTKDVTLTTAVPSSGTLLLSVGSPRFVQAFTNQTSVTVLGAAHGLASANLLYQVYDGSANPSVLQDGGVSVHPTTFDVVLTFAAPQSGTLLLARVPSVTPALALAGVPAPLRSTPLAPDPALRRARDADVAARLQQTLETLSARLALLETGYHTLLSHLGGLTSEDTPA